MHTKIVDFSKFSSLKIGNSHEVLIINKIANFDDYFIVGGANNILVSPNPPRFAMLSKDFEYIKENNNTITIGASTSSGKILSYCKKHNIGGFEFLGKLPGTLGGMIKMNAGVKKWEIFNNLISITTHKGKIEKKEIKYGYRFSDINSTIFEATFKKSGSFDLSLMDSFVKMRQNQPNLPSAGSCFKNPPHNFAGKLIEEVGLKGKRVGDVAFSKDHANFLVNLGSGTYKDAITLIELAKKEVYLKKDIKLQEEIVIV